MWIDEIDDATGSQFEKLSDADTLRMDTLRYVQSCLDLGDSEDKCEPDNYILRSFGIIGEAICKVYSAGELILRDCIGVWLTFISATTEVA